MSIQIQKVKFSKDNKGRECAAKRSGVQIAGMIFQTRSSAQTAADHKMEELYAAIEKKIKESGYPREISGADVYDDICDQIEGKENGSYILLSKFEEDVIFEYHITVMEDDFNLGVLTMRTPEGVFETDFDE